MSVFCLWREIVFDVAYKLGVQYKMGRRNRYLEWKDDGQINPCGCANFNSYVKNLHRFLFITDREIILGGGWATYRFLQVKGAMIIDPPTASQDPFPSHSILLRSRRERVAWA